MFKKKPAINDLLKSIKAEAKETRKTSPVNEMFVLKKDTQEEAKTLEGLMGSLLIQHQVKFAESFPDKSAIGTEFKNAFEKKENMAPAGTFKPCWEYTVRKKAEKIFSYNSKQYFVAVQELRKK